MAMIIRWFSIRRFVVWAVLFSVILVSFVFIGRRLNPHEGRLARRTMERAKMSRPKEQKANSHGQASQKRKETPAITNPVDNTRKEQHHMAVTSHPLQIPTHLPSFDLSPQFRKPFAMKHADIVQAFDHFYKSKMSMEEYLWNNFRIFALPEETMNKVGKRLTPPVRFDRSIKRHVALFYQYYLLAGGKEPRHHGIPSCKAIGVNPAQAEYSTDALNKLAGSQGSLSFKEIPYSLFGQMPPFPVNDKGNVVLITKEFKVKSKAGAKRKQSEDEDAAIANAEKAQRSFARELYALSSVYHPNVIQPVCYMKDTIPRLVFPHLKGGDLIPTQSDKVAFHHPMDVTRLINPDDAFLPRFFRQLVEAVYAVHQAGIAHFDLKGENFVIAGPDRNFYLPFDSKPLEHYSLVLIDFGLSMRLADAAEKDCIAVGTDVTMAPEQIMCNDAGGRGTDWWGVGASMWRTRIFWEPSIDEKTRSSLLRSKCPQFGHYIFPDQPFFSPEFKDLMKLFLTPSPDERDFSKTPELFQRLLDMPYLLRGLPPSERLKRETELAKQKNVKSIADLMAQEAESPDYPSPCRSHSMNSRDTDISTGEYDKFIADRDA